MPVARVDTLRSIAAGSITASYLPVGTALAHNWRMWRITNNTNANVFISLDGVNDNLFVPATSFVLYDLTANTDDDGSTALVMALGSIFYVRYETSASTGSLYIEGIYQKGQ